MIWLDTKKPLGVRCQHTVFRHSIAGGHALLQKRQENRIKPAAELGFVILGIQTGD